MTLSVQKHFSVFFLIEVLNSNLTVWHLKVYTIKFFQYIVVGLIFVNFISLACDNYGTTFTGFQGSLIAGFNRVILENMDESSCMEACVTSSDFLCLSFEMTNLGECFLSEETALTQPGHYKSHADYVYYQRNCKIAS